MKWFSNNSFFSLWLCLTLFFTCFSYSPGTVDVNLSIRSVFLSGFILLLGILVLTMMTKAILFPTLTKEMKIFLFLFSGYLIFAFPGMILNKVNFPLGVFNLSKIILTGCLIFFLFLIRKPGDRYLENISMLMNMLGISASLVGLYQLSLIPDFSHFNHQTTYRINSSFGHKNIFAEVILLCLPFALVSIQHQKKTVKLIGTLNLMLCSFFLIILLSRSAWVACIIASLSCIVVFLWNKGAASMHNFPFKKIILAFAVLTIPVLFLIFTNSSNSFSKQISSLLSSPFGSAGDRILLWKNSILLFLQEPLFGSGIGSWNVEILQFGRSGFWIEDKVTFYQHPHNDYLEILSEQGIFSFLSYLSAILFVLYLFLLKIRKDASLINYCFLFAFIAFLTFSFFSFPKARLEHVLLFSLIIPAAFSASLGSENKISKRFLGTIIILILLIAGIFIFSLMRLKNEKILGNAFTARTQMNWNLMQSELARVDRNFFTIDPLSTPIAWYQGTAAFNKGEYEHAKKYFLESCKLNPWHIHGLNNLGTCYEVKGMHDSAEWYIQKAIVLQPAFEEALLNLSAVYFNWGKSEKAADTFQKIINPEDSLKYNYFKGLIIPAYLGYLEAKETEPEIKAKLVEIKGDLPWANTIFDKAKTHKILFREQIMSDILYVFAKIENKEYLCLKYKNHKL